MKRLRVGNSSFWNIIFLAGMVMIVGCEQGPAPASLSPLQPANPVALAKGGNGVPANDRMNLNGRADKRVKRKDKSCTGTVSKRMGPPGGFLQHCDYRMDVPAGALDEVREMSITILATDGDFYDAKFQAVDFGADGWFLKPVKITIWYDKADLAGVNPADLVIVWYNEETGEWEEVETIVDFHAQKVVAHVWHFTQYSLAAR